MGRCCFLRLMWLIKSKWGLDVSLQTDLYLLQMWAFSFCLYLKAAASTLGTTNAASSYAHPIFAFITQLISMKPAPRPSCPGGGRAHSSVGQEHAQPPEGGRGQVPSSRMTQKQDHSSQTACSSPTETDSDLKPSLFPSSTHVSSIACPTPTSY